MHRLFLLVAFCLAACSSVSGPVISQGDRFTADPAQSTGYKLGVGDKLKITVYNEDSLSGEFQVNDQGALSLPLIGEVPAMGHTTTELTRIMHDKLADYLRDPRVSMEVSSFRPYYILGEVKTPGQYPYAVGLTVMNAIAAAQGFTPRSERKTVWLRRSGSGEEERYRLSPDLMVKPGDTVRVGERLF